MNALADPEIDARLLRVLVALADARSVSGAAERLGLTQSAVSHAVARLRRLVGDPLVVKSGRGIAVTPRASALAERARTLLDALQRFARPDAFEPARWQAEVTIAANDLQRDLLLPALLDRLRGEAPGVRLRVMASDAPSLALLRSDDCQLVISPRPPDGPDVVQRRLFQDRWRVFFDPDFRKAPSDRAAYLEAYQFTVVYEPPRSLAIDDLLSSRRVARRIVAWVPNFAGVAAFLRGSTRIATMPGLLRRGVLRDLADAPVPLACPPMSMYLLWHQRHQADAAHRWLRQAIETISAATTGRGGPDMAPH